MEQWILSVLASIIGGGLMGAIFTYYVSARDTKQKANEIEQAAIASLKAELRQSKLLCNHNAKLKHDETAPFIHFPTTVALNVTFQERYSYPRLTKLQKDLEAYVTRLLHINQLIDMYHMLWISPIAPTGTDSGAKGRREKLCFKIADLCSGELHFEEDDSENTINLPTAIDNALKRIGELGKA